MARSNLQTSANSPAIALADSLPVATDISVFLEQANRQLLHRITLISFVGTLLLNVTVGIIFILTRNPSIGLVTGITAVVTTGLAIGWWLAHNASRWLTVIWQTGVFFLACFAPGLIFPEIDFLIGLGSVVIICFVSINNNGRLTMIVGVACVLASLIALSHPFPASMTFGLGEVLQPLKAILGTTIILNGWFIYHRLMALQQAALALAESRATEASAARAQAEAARAEVERLQQNEQQRLLALVETLELPILPVGASTLVVPLVGDLDSRRATTIQQRLLEAVAHQRIQTVVVDVTSISILDTVVAQQLVEIAQAVRLLGARIVISGINARLAQTLVGLDVALSDIETPGNLGQALAATRGWD
jgi:anti-anti-sigma factor